MNEPIFDVPHLIFYAPDKQEIEESEETYRQQNNYCLCTPVLARLVIPDTAMVP